MADATKQILAKPIQLADQLIQWSAIAQTNKHEFLELKGRAEKLIAALRQAARVDLYERPARRIMADTEQALSKALALADKCRHGGIANRLLHIIPSATSATIAKTCTQIDNSVADVHWLVRVSTPAAEGEDDGDGDGDAHLYGLSPIAQNEPILTPIWGNIAALHTGRPDARTEAAATLASLARDNHHYAQLIITEDGIAPLLRLLKEGKVEAQESAARTLGLLGRDPKSVELLIAAGASAAFAKVLKDGPMKAQAAVAWAVSELATNDPNCQDAFVQSNVVRLLVSHLAFETIQEHSKYAIHSIVLANNKPAVGSKGHSKISQFHTVVQSTVVSAGHINRGREKEDTSTKAALKAMAAKALWRLAKGNLDVCRSITESRAFLCFAVLLEKGEGDVRYNSTMALMEISRVAEHNTDLRRVAFRPNSPAGKAVIDQFVRVLKEGDYNDLLVPSITALGCLARTFRATETRVVSQLVRLLEEEEEVVVVREALVALTKFACTQNYLHVNHSRTIVDAGGARHLIQLVYFGGKAQIEALILLCYIAKHVPDSHELAKAEVLSTLSWASKQAHLVQDEGVVDLLPEAKSSLEFYQSSKV